MSWLITGAEKTPVDPQFGSVSLLLHGNGTNGSTTITDSSPTPKTVTAVGNAQISTVQSKFGGASIAFDGTGDYLTAPLSTDWNINGDYTVEAWFRTNAISGVHAAIFVATMNNSASSGWLIGHFQGDMFARLNGTLFYSAGAAPFPVDTWKHFAFVCAGVNYRAYLNGTQVYSGSSATTTNSSALYVGNQPDLDSLRWTNGYIDDLRITKGVARYTSNFSVPPAQFPDI